MFLFHGVQGGMVWWTRGWDPISLLFQGLTDSTTTAVVGLITSLAPTGGSNHPYLLEPNRLTGHHITTKSVRIRFTNSWERGDLWLFLWEERFFYVNQSGIVKGKIWQFQTALLKCKKLPDASGQWIIESPRWDWIPPFLTPFSSFLHPTRHTLLQ